MATSNGNRRFGERNEKENEVDSLPATGVSISSEILPVATGGNISSEILPVATGGSISSEILPVFAPRRR